MAEIMTPERLNADFVQATKVDIYGQRIVGEGFNGMRHAPRSRGYHVSFVPFTRKIVIRRNSSKHGEWSMEIDVDKVGSIQIWTKKDGPNISWERGADGVLRRNH